MSKYKLNVKFTDEALRVIYASGEKLSLTKEVSGDKGKSVIWVATSPFKSNSIEWEQNFLIYSSRQEVQNGATIKKLSDAEAMTGVLYEFEDAIFQNAHADGCVGKNEYGIHNGMEEYSALTFGLAQAVTVNGETQEGNPVNAISIPYNRNCVMSPVEKVKVFLGGHTDNGVVVTKEFSNAICVEFRGNETEKTITYDCVKGMFIPVE